MDLKTIAITAVAVIVILIVLKKTGMDSKIGLSSFEADSEI